MFNFRRQKKEPENLKAVLARLKELEDDCKKTSGELEALKKQSRFSIQKLGMIRFNPFREVGGDQSFSLALLDDNDTGAVLTSHYTRKENRIYGKPIKRGQSEYPLSEEEQEAIKMAKNPESKIILNGEKKNGKKNSKKSNSNNTF